MKGLLLNSAINLVIIYSGSIVCFLPTHRCLLYILLYPSLSVAASASNLLNIAIRWRRLSNIVVKVIIVLHESGGDLLTLGRYSHHDREQFCVLFWLLLELIWFTNGVETYLAQSSVWQDTCTVHCFKLMFLRVWWVACALFFLLCRVCCLRRLAVKRIDHGFAFFVLVVRELRLVCKFGLLSLSYLIILINQLFSLILELLRGVVQLFVRWSLFCFTAYDSTRALAQLRFCHISSTLYLQVALHLSLSFFFILYLNCLRVISLEEVINLAFRLSCVCAWTLIISMFGGNKIWWSGSTLLTVVVLGCPVLSFLSITFLRVEQVF